MNNVQKVNNCISHNLLDLVMGQVYSENFGLLCKSSIPPNVPLLWSIVWGMYNGLFTAELKSIHSTGNGTSHHM
jgi:hypothetical protein